MALSDYNGGPDALTKHMTSEQMQQMLEDRKAELHPDLVEWMEEGTWGPMLRSPLVYQIPMFSPGWANKAYEAKREALRKAIEQQDWRSIIWIHERPHRLNALIEYVLGRYEDDGSIIPLCRQRKKDIRKFEPLVRAVWIDSENIQQHKAEWNAIFNDGDMLGVWLGDEEDREKFLALPDPIPAYRGGVVGDFSWTTDPAIADFFARRSGFQKRHALIPKSECFGYTNDRGESELLVRLTPERYALVYPEGEPA